jgi:hypothetical protein
MLPIRPGVLDGDIAGHMRRLPDPADPYGSVMVGS